MKHVELIEKEIFQLLDRYAKENDLKVSLNSNYDRGTIQIKVYE